MDGARCQSAGEESGEEEGAEKGVGELYGGYKV